MRINILERATSAVRRIFSDERPVDEPRNQNRTDEARHARTARREPDIPLDRLAETYTPHQTSLKSSFRMTGEELQRDQEFATGVADERWKDEDRFTNKSGDPRIGTHGRSYEPGERND